MDRKYYSCTTFDKLDPILSVAQPLSFQNLGYVRRADPEALKEVFEKYATAEIDGERYMTDVDFLVRYLGLFPEEGFNRRSCKLLSGVLDTSKDK